MDAMRLTEVRCGEAPFTLRLTWQDGTEQIVDLSGLVATSRRFRRLAGRPDLFRDVEEVNWGHGVAWPDGIDCSAESLARIAGRQ